MKKVLTVLVALILIIGVTGCGKQDANVEITTSSEQQLTAFEQFEKGLEDEGLEYEKVTMAAEMLGAIEGYKYKFESGKAEIYRFDKDSDTIKDAAENKSLYMEGFGSFPVEVNGNLALIVEDDENSKVISKIFNAIE